MSRPNLIGADALEPFRETSRKLRHVIPLLFGSLLMSFSQPALADSHTNPRTITVSASADVDAQPDAATITTGVTTDAATARDALTANSKTVQALIDGLIETGINQKDIQTSGLNINPRYDRPKSDAAPTIRGYSVTNNITITSRDISKLGDVLDKLVSLGANQMHGLSFQVTDAENLKDKARSKAIANARRRAELFASAADAKVGKVWHISEETSHNAPRPMMARARTMAAESVPIEAGTQSLTARVTVTWELED